MQFKDILSDIELMVGKELCSINPQTGPIVITNVDRVSKKYFIKTDDSSKLHSRSFRELEDIWFELTRKGFVNVDQALFGGGSSRNQPETVFAHLPYIQHFKYKDRKHLLLRGHKVHNLGELSELPSSELRVIRKKIENYMALSNSDISLIQSEVIESLQKSLDSIFKKFPGDAIVIEAEKSLNKLEELEAEVSSAIVSLESSSTIYEDDNLEVDEDELQLSLDTLIDDQSVTGIENERVDEDEKTTESSGKPRIRQHTPTLSLIYDRLSFDEIELQPDFQRKDRIWDIPKKSKLIESILMGLPLPVFYFGEKPNGDWVVVDGLQRITSVFDFMRGDFELEKLETLKDYNGKTFRTLDRIEQRKIREYQITSHLIDIESDRENIIVELFHRINTYGVRLSDQEIRSALNQGTSVTFLRYIAGLKQFKLATNDKIKADRQRDMEVCLGAISFIVLGYKNFEYNKYDTFLSTTMKEMNKYKLSVSDGISIDEGNSVIYENESSKFYIELSSRIKSALTLAHEVFGVYAFKKVPGFDKKTPINKPLFELIITYFSSMDEEQRNIVRKHSSNLIDTLYQAISFDKEDYADWISDKYNNQGRGFNYSISTSTGKKVTVQYRFDAFRNILRASTGVDVEITPLQMENV